MIHQLHILGSTVTITKAGTYVISGNVTEGNIIVNATDKGTVRLILNNASISNTTTAPIKVLDAKKVILTLADNTTNTITDSSRLSTEEDYSAAIYYCLLYKYPSPRDRTRSRMPSSA